jgi:hypothetical protein
MRKTITKNVKLTKYGNFCATADNKKIKNYTPYKASGKDLNKCLAACARLGNECMAVEFYPSQPNGCFHILASKNKGVPAKGMPGK